MIKLLKIVCFVGLFSSFTNALVAPPVITKVDPYTCTRTRIFWQNTDSKANGFLLYRNGVLVSVLEKDSSSYIDYALTPGTIYEYSIKATSEADTSLMSSVVSGKTYLLNAPQLLSLISVNNSLAVHFKDLSEYESYHTLALYLKQDTIHPLFSDTIIPGNRYNIGELVSYIPDKYFSVNKNLVIKATAVYEDDGLKLSSTFDTFNLCIDSLIPKQKRLSLTEKLGSFPILLNQWAIQTGDSIIMTEKNSDVLNLSVFDISNPVSITRKPSLYSANDFYASCLGYSVQNNNLFKTTNDAILHYQFLNNQFSLKSTLIATDIIYSDTIRCFQGPIYFKDNWAFVKLYFEKLYTAKEYEGQIFLTALNWDSLNGLGNKAQTNYCAKYCPNKKFIQH